MSYIKQPLFIIQIGHEVIHSIQSHPSDYIHSLEELPSSDSSELTIKISLHKSKPSKSSHFFKQKQPVHQKKKKNPNKQLKKPKGKAPAKTKKSSSDYLILGDSYYASDDVRQVTRRFLDDHQQQTMRVMKVERLKKKEQKNISKIQAYVHTFLYCLKVENPLQTLSEEQKLTLYKLLKSSDKNEIQMQDIFKEAVQHLQGITNNYQQVFPNKAIQISRWKNKTMHQLSTAKNFIEHESSFEGDYNLQRQLQILQQQMFFPDLNKQVKQLRQRISKYLSNQIQQSQKQAQNQEDNGILWVIKRLLEYILQNEETASQIYCKLVQSNSIDEPLLSDDLFVAFQRSLIQNSQDCEEQQQNSIHIFNKAVFDMINQAAPCVICQNNGQNLEEILWNVFKASMKWEHEQLNMQNSQVLIYFGQQLVQGLVEQALYDFLECF